VSAAGGPPARRTERQSTPGAPQSHASAAVGTHRCSRTRSRQSSPAAAVARDLGSRHPPLQSAQQVGFPHGCSLSLLGRALRNQRNVGSFAKQASMPQGIG